MSTQNTIESPMPYLDDGLFYSLWKYANASRLTEKKLITFWDLIPPKTSASWAIFRFLKHLQYLGIELEGIVLHTEIYKRYCLDEYDSLVTYAKANPEKEASVAILALINGNCTMANLFRIFDIMHGGIKIVTKGEGFIEFLEFSSTTSEENIEPLRKYLEAYLSSYASGKLYAANDENFYRFLRQKSIFLKQIERSVNDFGPKFLFKHNGSIAIEHEGGIELNDGKSYLFIHTLAALEKEGSIQVKCIFIEDRDIPPQEQTDEYKISIVCSEGLLTQNTAEIHLSSEEGDLIRLSQEKIRFEEKESSIYVGEKRIKLPPYKNEYNLCQVLWQKNINEPIDWSVVYEKITGYYENYWGKPQDLKEHWRSVYDAMQQLNKRVRKEANTEDSLCSWSEKTVARNY